MNDDSIYLTKSRHLAGLQCEKRLWRQVHQPLSQDEKEELEPGSIKEMGSEIGRFAHGLFPGGILVEEAPWEHAQAVERTRRLMADPDVPAIFEAAFAASDVRVRVDILERLPRGRWGLREVKASTDLKDHYLDDLSVQTWAVQAAGLRVGSMQLLHLNKEYRRGQTGIACGELFLRVDLTKEVRAAQKSLSGTIASQQDLLRRKASPAVEPSSHCTSPFACEFWDDCTSSKPADWILYLPRLKRAKHVELQTLGVERISRIPEDFPLSEQQARIRRTLLTREPFVSSDLGVSLRPARPPTVYLDFETVFAALPLWSGLRPYQQVPFQWSAHFLGRAGAVRHREFLADGTGDPRQEFAKTLIDQLDTNDMPIVVYSGFEKQRLAELEDELPRSARRAVARIRARLFDLLDVVRAHVYDPAFGFSYSIKTVGPALAPHVSYNDLVVSDGGAASSAFYRIVTGQMSPGESQAQVRADLLAYCARDTLALMEVHKALIQLSKTA